MAIPGLEPELANLSTPRSSCQIKPHSKIDVVNAWQELRSLRLRQDLGPGGYKRDFSGGRKDLDHDGCDTRAEILARDFRHARFGSAKPCRLVGGVPYDPYTGKTTSFTAAPEAVIQTDHVMALGNTWASGANRWSSAQR